VHTVALLFVILAGAAVLSLMVWTALDWVRSDRARAERRQREQDGDQPPSA
jgi:hypothetical protein